MGTVVIVAIFFASNVVENIGIMALDTYCNSDV